MRPCRVCGAAPDLNIVDGVLRDLRALLGPDWRSVGKGRSGHACMTCEVTHPWRECFVAFDWICHQCQLWHARQMGIVR